ncbi:MAG: Trk system potassium transporter TrkA [Alphaproteobacteria bacterium]|nr:Trk system potassium transporter TrkA [Alphaproteobacteria bacterium]
MKIIVCGGGQVGYGIVRYLASGDADIVLIDTDATQIKRATDRLDVKGIVGNAALPNILEEAGAKDADILIAVTQFDEVNLIACQIGGTLFGIPTKIARIRDQNYRSPKWAELFEQHYLTVDKVISPEAEIANILLQLSQISGIFDYIPITEPKVKLLGVICTDDTPIIHTPLRQLGELFPYLNFNIIAIFRDKEAFIPKGKDQLLPDDKVYFLVETDKVQRALSAFGYEETHSKRLIISGGGKIGLSLAKQLKQDLPKLSFTMVEKKREIALQIVEELQDKIVLFGDILEPDFFKELNLDGDETFMALTNSNETNILASSLAKYHGCKRTISLVTSQNYDPIIRPLSIDAVVQPNLVTISSILKHVRRGKIQAVHSLREEFGEIIEAHLLETSRLIGPPFSEIQLPKGIMIACIIRENKVIFPNDRTILESNDYLIVIAEKAQIKKAEKLFTVGLDYF